MDVACVHRTRRLRAGRLPRGPRRAAPEPRRGRRARPLDRRRRDRCAADPPDQPAAGRGLVPPTTPRSRTSTCAGPVDVIGLPRTGTTALGLDAVARPAVPQPADVGAAQPGAAAGARRRARRSPPAGLRRRDRPAAGRGPRHAPLRGRRQRRGQRRARAWPSTASSTRCRCTATTAGGVRPTRPSRSTTTGGWSSCSASQRPPNRWLFKAPHHKFHLEAVVRRLSGRPVRDDPPRPGEGDAVVRQPGVEHLPDAADDRVTT